MSDASGYIVGAILGQRYDKILRAIYNVSQTLDAYSTKLHHNWEANVSRGFYGG